MRLFQCEGLGHSGVVLQNRELVQAKTRITLDNARMVGVEATGDTSSTDPQMTTTQELVRVLAQRVTVDDLVAGTSFQYDFVTAR